MGLWPALQCNQCPGIIATCPTGVWGLSRPQQQGADTGQPGLEQGQARAVLLLPRSITASSLKQTPPQLPAAFTVTPEPSATVFTPYLTSPLSLSPFDTLGSTQNESFKKRLPTSLLLLVPFFDHSHYPRFPWSYMPCQSFSTCLFVQEAFPDSPDTSQLSIL